MDKSIVKVGNVSTENSQAGSVYGSWGAFPTICAGTHGYAMGYIVVKRCKDGEKSDERKYQHK